MIYHLIYNLLLVAFQPLMPKNISYFIILTYPVFLLYLPPTDYDFIYYQQAFESIYFDPSAPLWFRSSSVLTAEPGWFAWNGLVALFTDNFRWFLVTNFLVTCSLFLYSLRLFGIDRKTIGLMFILMVPVQFPILMFWSPRSAIPMGLCWLAIALMYRKKYAFSFLSFFICLSIHSQYIPLGYVSLLVLIMMGILKIGEGQYPRLFAVTLAAISSVAVLLLIVPYLSFLPSAAIIESKLSYLERGSEGVRFSALLSLVIYPILLMVLLKRGKVNGSVATISFIFTVFSFVINLIFIGSPHVAGRISRGSEYFLQPFLMAKASESLPYYVGILILLFNILIAPFMYRELYNYDMNGFF